MLGFGAIGECAIGEIPVEPAKTSGKLRDQFRQFREEMLTTTLTPNQFWQRWHRVLDAVENAIPGRPRAVDSALERYDALVDGGRSTSRRHHHQLKEDAVKGICTVRALEMALLERVKTK